MFRKLWKRSPQMERLNWTPLNRSINMILKPTCGIFIKMKILTTRNGQNSLFCALEEKKYIQNKKASAVNKRAVAVLKEVQMQSVPFVDVEISNQNKTAQPIVRVEKITSRTIQKLQGNESKGGTRTRPSFALPSRSQTRSRFGSPSGSRSRPSSRSSSGTRASRRFRSPSSPPARSHLFGLPSGSRKMHDSTSPSGSRSRPHSKSLSASQSRLHSVSPLGYRSRRRFRSPSRNRTEIHFELPSPTGSRERSRCRSPSRNRSRSYSGSPSGSQTRPHSASQPASRERSCRRLPSVFLSRPLFGGPSISRSRSRPRSPATYEEQSRYRSPSSSRVRLNSQSTTDSRTRPHLGSPSGSRTRSRYGSPAGSGERRSSETPLRSRSRSRSGSLAKPRERRSSETPLRSRARSRSGSLARPRERTSFETLSGSQSRSRSGSPAGSRERPHSRSPSGLRARSGGEQNQRNMRSLLRDRAARGNRKSQKMSEFIYNSINYYRDPDSPGYADSRNRYKFINEQVYLGEGFSINSYQWEVIKLSTRPSIFLTDLACNIWGPENLCNRALDLTKGVKNIYNRSPVKLIERNYLRLLISLYADYLLKKSYKESECVAYLLKATNTLSNKIKNLRSQERKRENRNPTNQSVKRRLR